MFTAFLFIKYPNWKQAKYAPAGERRNMRYYSAIQWNKLITLMELQRSREVGGVVGTDLVIFQNKNSGAT